MKINRHTQYNNQDYMVSSDESANISAQAEEKKQEKDNFLEEDDDFCEEEDDYSNDDLYNIVSWGADLSFRELISMYEEDELLKPELQRYYVWDKTEASRFIESLLLGLPVPSIFLANTADSKKLIIDGYQRIMTVYDYVRKGLWSKDNKTFKLSNSDKINERYRNKSFNELTSDEQRKIRSTTIHAIIFEQKSPQDNDTSLYQVFERINTGGRTLMPQEIRNCVNQGPFNKLLFELNKDANWRELWGKMEIDPRMKDMEYILRFLAMNTKDILQSTVNKISLKKYLNEFMGAKSSQTDEFLLEKKNEFHNVMKFIKQHIGENAFYNISSTDNKIRKRFYPTIFDSISIAVAIALEKRGSSIPDFNLEEKRISLLKDENYKKCISEGTMQVAHIHGRIRLALKYLFDLDYEQ